MSRAELWKALADATDAVEAAYDECAREPTPAARAALAAAEREYAQRLYPVIGQVAAFTYEAGLVTYQAAIGTEDEAAAREVFEVAQVALLAALERAMALNNEPDEKGGRDG